MNYPPSIVKTLRRLAVMPIAHLPQDDPIMKWWMDTAADRTLALKEVVAPTFQPTSVLGVPLDQVRQAIEFVRAHSGTFDPARMADHLAEAVARGRRDAVEAERARIEGKGGTVPPEDQIPEALDAQIEALP